MVYRIYLCYSSTSLRRTVKALEPWLLRSHVVLWPWIHKLGHMADNFTVPRRGVQCFLVEETLIQIRAVEARLWVAVDPVNRKFLGLHVSRTRNVFVAHMFLRALVRRYVRRPPYADGGSWYPLAAKWTRLGHTVYGDELKNVMERFVKAVKDRTACFDDYFPLPQRGMWLWHARIWLSVFALITDHVTIPVESPLAGVDNIEVYRFEKFASKALT